MKKFFGIGIVAIILLAALCIGCTDKSPANSPANSNNVLASPLGGAPYYGNGVYYFPFTDANFGNQLAGVLKQRVELKILASALDVEGSGVEHGYWIIFQENRTSLLEPNDAQRELIESVVAYGGGVYYFPVTDERFGQSLSAFIGTHPDLSLSSLDLDVEDIGIERGYWAVFQPNAEINA
ncbi:MAG: hypothetical protein WC520_01735 [Candidatus Paceibacterota bacterium]